MPKKIKTPFILIIALLSVVFALPNFVPKEQRMSHQFLAEWPTFNLGLDLQGGSHLLLEVDTFSIREEHRDKLRDEARQVLREARIPIAGLRRENTGVEVVLRDEASFDKAQKALSPLTAVQQSTILNQRLAVKQADMVIRDKTRIFLELNEAGLNEKVRQSVDQSIAIVERRINELGTVEPNIQRQGADRIILQVPGLDDPERLKTLLGQTAKLTFRMVDTAVTAAEIETGIVPPETEILQSNDDLPQSYAIRRQVMISGEDLVDAQAAYDQRTGEPVVNFRFNTAGALRFAEITEQNVGQPFAIILDNAVISAPVIREPIRGGSGQISGNFSVESANDLAILLRAGALPAPLNIIEERTVGPGLGVDSIEAGRIASTIALIGVIGFMILTYRLFGIFASIALIINISILLSGLSILGATLTLPGIAGIILTIGMAVDASVLVFERIKEEQDAIKHAGKAIDAGFSHAFSTILDANITTLIAALVLFSLGSGPIRGFAITLSIGTLATLFVTVYVLRVIINIWYRNQRPQSLKF